MTIDRTKMRWNGWGRLDHRDDLSSRDDVWKWLAAELGMPTLLVTPAHGFDGIALAPSRLADGAREKLRLALGDDRVREDKFERVYHAYGRSYHDVLRLRAGDLSQAPDAVVYPRNTEDVQLVLAVAGEFAIAIVPFGGGTSVVGGVSATPDGFHAVITVDLTAMDRVIAIDPISQTAVVEAGIYGPDLKAALSEHDLVLGHTPQSFEFSTLGGWIAHSGAGQSSDRYGRAEDWLADAKLVTPRGVLRAGGFPASSAGPNLLALTLGSEGVFGIVTEATIRVRSRPALSDYSGFLFRDLQSGVSTLQQTIRAEIPVTMLRLSDSSETHFYRAFASLRSQSPIRDRIAQTFLKARGYSDAACALIAGFEGDERTVRNAKERFEAIAKSYGALRLGHKQGDRWKNARFEGPYLRDPIMDRGAGVDTLETATRWSNLNTLYVAVRDALNKAIRENAPRPGAHGIVMCHISHTYRDGASLYFTYVFPRILDGEVAQWRAIKKAASDAIAAHGGTISHHHGVGEDHLPWIGGEKGSLGIDILRAIKMALDPKGIMNPGKLIPKLTSD